MTDFEGYSRDRFLKPAIHAGIVTPPDAAEQRAAFQPFRLETIAHDGAYGVSFRIEIPKRERRSDLRVVVDIEVESGAIGIGLVSGDFSSFVGAESVISAGPRRTVYVVMDDHDATAHLMLRNASHKGVSVARVLNIEIRNVDPAEERLAALKSSLWDAPITAADCFRRTRGDADTARKTLAGLGRPQAESSAALKFSLAITHTSRVWDWERCAQDYLRERYRRPNRLDGLPPFEQLPSAEQSRSYQGRLTLFDLTIDANGFHIAARRCIDSEHKLNHACNMNGQLVICLDDYVATVPATAEDSSYRIDRIDDVWFAGLQMIFPVDDTHCVVSASAPDALMLLDLSARRVTRRWRVPADRYGHNYTLTEASSVHDHFIANDMQLAHLNCAFPDGHGGFWISTLAQGDIGHVAPDGIYELVASGFVGCHGIRYSRELDSLYFCDSCNGRLISIGASRVPRVIGKVESRWLHDAQHLVGDIFLLCLGDQNAIVLLDASSNVELARFDMRARGENVQYVNLVRNSLRRD